jgi:hypothetical protein
MEYPQNDRAYDMSGAFVANAESMCKLATWKDGGRKKHCGDRIVITRARILMTCHLFFFMQ